MKHGELLSKAWNIIWEHKYLIVLGLLVALGSSGSQATAQSANQPVLKLDQQWELPLPPDWGSESVAPMQDIRLPTVSTAYATFLVGIALIAALAVWVVSTISRGALIVGASAADRGETTGLRESFAAAWQRGWRLLGIGAFPAIPVLFLLLGALGAASMYSGLPPVIDSLVQIGAPRNITVILAGLTFVALPLALVLNTLRTFANRACMLEDCGLVAAYGRGLGVLFENIGSALILLVIQVGIGIVLALSLLLPALCCLFWPLLLLVQGVSAAFFSTVWTLAWRQWSAATSP